MTKEEILKFAWNNGACIDGIRRFENDEPLNIGDLRWASEHSLNLGYEVYLTAVSKYGLGLQYVPKGLRTYELCMAAVKQYGWTLKYVPEEHRTYKICIEAVKKHGSVIKFVPEEHRTYELCMVAVKKYGWAMEYVPKKYRQQINKELN